ncbi:MAG: MAPEG family protein [Thiolinea sp.]|jgi:hypothetical protein
MQSFSILYPAFAMAFLTFGAGVWLLNMRIKAYKSGTDPRYFKLNQGELPVYAKQAEQHYENLFEMPVLFYVVLLLAFVTQTANVGLVFLAWAYVAVRAAHSYVHLGENKLLLRRNVFLASFAILLVMWIWVLLALFI